MEAEAGVRRTQHTKRGAVFFFFFTCRKVWVTFFFFFFLKWESTTTSFLGVTDRSFSAKVKLGWKTQFAWDVSGGHSRVGPARRRLVSVSFGCYGNDKHCAGACIPWATVESPTRRFQVRIPGRIVNEHRISVLFRTRCGNSFKDTWPLSYIPFTQPVMIPHLHRISYIISKQMLLMCACARHFAHWMWARALGRFTRGLTHFKSIMTSYRHGAHKNHILPQPVIAPLCRLITGLSTLLLCCRVFLIYKRWRGGLAAACHAYRQSTQPGWEPLKLWWRKPWRCRWSHLRHICCTSAVCSDSLYVTVLAEKGLHGGRTLSCYPWGVEGQGLGGTPVVIHCTESPSLPWQRDGLLRWRRATCWLDRLQKTNLELCKVSTLKYSHYLKISSF